MSPGGSGGEVKIKVSWLKQKVDEVTNQPLLEFDEQQLSSFEPRTTTFRMVKHACSYPAPPHKVRMWCSSLGAQPDLPSVMDLNMFINTFELITEERHTLEMAHLTGGETIAFEMVQSDQMSELSGFLLGNTKAGLKGTVLGPAAAAAAGALHAGSKAGGEGEKPLSKEQAAKDEEERSRLAEELIAEEEEEARRKEKKKAKKKGKKDKQKERKKTSTSTGKEGEDDDTDKDDDEPDGPPEPPLAEPEPERPAARTTCASCGADGAAASQPTPHRGAAKQAAGGAAGIGADDASEAAAGAHVDRGASSDTKLDLADAAAAAAGLAAVGAGGGARDAQSHAGSSDAETEALRLQLRRSEEVIRALVLQCLEERKAKEAALEEVQNLQDRNMAMQVQNEEVARISAEMYAGTMNPKDFGRGFQRASGRTIPK